MVRVDSRMVLGATLFATPGLKHGIDLAGLGVLVFVVLVVGVGLILGRYRGSRPGPPDPNGGDGWGKGRPPPDPRLPDRPRGASRSTLLHPRACACGARPGLRTCCRGGRDDPPASPTGRQRVPRASARPNDRNVERTSADHLRARLCR